METTVSPINDIVDEFTEVEQKFCLLDVDYARRRLAEIGGELRGSSHQRDVYFDHPERSFRADPKSSEWLRLRSQDGVVSLNYKLWYPLDAPVKTHCDEFETQVANGEAMRRTLTALGYDELVVVSKHREEWQLGDVIVAIDEVETLGTFVELEYVGRGATVADAHRQLAALVSDLNLKLGSSHDGYPHQLLALKA